MPGTDNKGAPVRPFGILSWEGNGREKKKRKRERKVLRGTERREREREKEKREMERDKAKVQGKEKERRQANWLFSHPVSSLPHGRSTSPRFKAACLPPV